MSDVFEVTSKETEATPKPEADSELAGLPPPRRPWRRTTLVTLAAGSIGSILLAIAVLPEVAYSLRSGEPLAIGELGKTVPDRKLANHWVQGEGELSVARAISYRRPLERDSYRLAQVVDNPRVWVEVRVPQNEEGSRFVPPASFVGRLVPVSDLGLRQQELKDAVNTSGLSPLRDDAWLLLDGESPHGLRWVIALFVLLLAFSAFNVTGLFRLGRPIAPAPGRAS